MTRVLAIIQLCLAFTLILWVLAKPFTSDYFMTRSELLLFQTVTGQGNGFIPTEKLQRHADRFAQLDPQRQSRILEGYRQLEMRVQTPFLTKSRESLQGLLVDLPPFTQAWLLFSISIAILLLRGTEGAMTAAWLLPIIAVGCAVDNGREVVLGPSSIDELLLPTEQFLLNRYSRELSTDQKTLLTRAWQRYLIEYWTEQIPSDDPQMYNIQLESGEHALTVARIERRLEAMPHRNVESAGWLLSLLYFVWNLCFAFLVNHSRQRDAYVKQNSHS